MPTRPRVILADDHTMLLEAFCRLLEPACVIVGCVTDGRALLEEAARLKPDVIILDVSMPLLNGLEAARNLQQSLPAIKLIFLTVNEDPQVAAHALRAGAAGYVLKNSAARELFEAIREVLDGRRYITPRIAADVLKELVAADESPTAERLTARQREVLQLLAEGHSMKQAAHILQVSTRTIAFHKYRMMEALRVQSSAQLIQFAVRHSLVRS